MDTSNEEEINIIILTVLDRTLMSDEYIRKVKHNRDDYASRHGKRTRRQIIGVH